MARIIRENSLAAKAPWMVLLGDQENSRGKALYFQVLRLTVTHFILERLWHVEFRLEHQLALVVLRLWGQRVSLIKVGLTDPLRKN